MERLSIFQLGNRTAGGGRRPNSPSSHHRIHSPKTRSTRRILVALTVALAAGLAAGVFGLAGRAGADCGSIPFSGPLIVDSFSVVKEETGKLVGAMTGGGGKASRLARVEFDPLKVSVFEPQQRALILWNGQEEILLLSTDQKATEKSAVLEVIPLPSEPKVRLGSFETFEKAQKLVVEKRMWACAHGGAQAGAAALPDSAGRITFQQKMGAHDLAVATVVDKDGFVAFVQKFLQEKYKTPEAPIRPEFVAIIQSYLDEGFRWFAFDVIQLGDSVQTRQPIEYRFASDHVFYPMRISTLERGETKVDLLVFTPGRVGQFTGLAGEAIRREPVVNVSPLEVEALEASWSGFFTPRTPESVLTMNQWAIEGDIATFTRDVKAR